MERIIDILYARRYLGLPVLAMIIVNIIATAVRQCVTDEPVSWLSAVIGSVIGSTILVLLYRREDRLFFHPRHCLQLDTEISDCLQVERRIKEYCQEEGIPFKITMNEDNAWAGVWRLKVHLMHRTDVMKLKLVL